jgi:hypothetical protein
MSSFVTIVVSTMSNAACTAFLASALMEFASAIASHSDAIPAINAPAASFRFISLPHCFSGLPEWWSADA